MDTDSKKTAKRTRHDPSFWLGDALGDRPYNPPGTTPGRSWEAHHIVPVKLPAADPMKAMMFRCSVHPNARQNGVYLRGIDVKRTRRDASPNPRYEALKAHDAGLAARTYHGDTFRSIYISHLTAGLHDSLGLGERCPIGENLPASELAAFEERLIDGAVDLGFPVN